MAETAVNVTKLESRSHDNPDEVRSPAKTRVEIVRLPGYSLARMNMFWLVWRRTPGLSTMPVTSWPGP